MKDIEAPFQFRVVEIVGSRDRSWVSKDVIAEFEGREEAITGFDVGSRFGRGNYAVERCGRVKEIMLLREVLIKRGSLVSCYYSESSWPRLKRNSAAGVLHIPCEGEEKHHCAIIVTEVYKSQNQ